MANELILVAEDTPRDLPRADSVVPQDPTATCICVVAKPEVALLYAFSSKRNLNGS